MKTTLSIGVDLTSAEAVGQSLQTHGERYLERVYTERERHDCRSDAGRLAARFGGQGGSREGPAPRG